MLKILNEQNLLEIKNKIINLLRTKKIKIKIKIIILLGNHPKEEIIRNK